MICKFCGSRRIKTFSDSGDPFDRYPEKTVCLDCGRVLFDELDVVAAMEKVICRLLTVCEGQAEGAIRLQSAVYLEPALYVKEEQYSADDYLAIIDEAEQYVIVERESYESNLFHGPTADTTHRKHESVQNGKTIAADDIIAKDGKFYAVRTLCDVHYLHNREGDREFSYDTYLLPDGREYRVYIHEDVRVYGHDGEEDSRETYRFQRLEKKQA